MKYTYYRLLDPQHENVVIREENDDFNLHFEFDPEKGWVKSGLMLHYIWPDSDLYDCYEEIEESEALELIAGEGVFEHNAEEDNSYRRSKDHCYDGRRQGLS